MLRITDPQRQYFSLKTEIDTAIQAVCLSGQFIKGPALHSFESEFASYLGCQYAVGVNSGTDALLMALKAADIGPGDEVITTAMSFLATAEAISLTGATPIFIDIEPGTECMHPDHLAQVVTEKSKAIIPVHLHGYPCDMPKIMAFAKEHKLIVIEDCAQSTGATYAGKQTGTWGDFGCFSFFPTKNLGAFGDGGAVVTRDPHYAQQLKILREHGSAKKNFQDRLGFNSRLDSLQAAILSVKLPHLDRWNQQRRDLATHYDTLLGVVSTEFPVRRPPLNAGVDSESVFHHYILRFQGHLAGQRDQIQAALKVAGVECLPYYPHPLHLQTLYQADYQRGDFPEAEDCAQNSLALPMFPELTQKEQVQVVQTLTQVLREQF